MNIYDVVATKIELDALKIEHDLSIFYDRVRMHTKSAETICDEWGSIENYVNVLYWMKFVKRYNPTQMKNIVGKSSLPRSYQNIGWGYDSFDFDECNKHYDEYLAELERIKNEFDYEDAVYKSEDFIKKSQKARGISSKKLLQCYKAKSEEELIRRLYYYHYVHELSTYDISLIYGFSSRAIEQLLTQLSMNLSTSEAQKRAAKKRDYKQIEATRRHTVANNLLYDGMFGSHAENNVRTLLSTRLENVLASKYEIIVGLNTRTIIPPKEVDIPIILINKDTSKIIKIAVEVDGESFHSSEQAVKRDSEKNAIVTEHGWKIIRVFLPNDRNTSTANGKAIKGLVDGVVDIIYKLVNEKNIEETGNSSKEMLCPKCGGKLILRTATKGQFAGSRFWGCSKYPKCNYIRNE